LGCHSLHHYYPRRAYHYAHHPLRPHFKLIFFVTHSDDAWALVLSTITSQLDRNYLALACETILDGGVGGEFISTVEQIDDINDRTPWACTPHFQEQLRLLKILCVRHVMIQVLASSVTGMHIRGELTTATYTHCCSKITSEDTAVYNRIHSLLDNLISIATSTYNILEPANKRKIEMVYLLTTNWALQIRVWLLPSCSWDLSHILQRMAAATTIQLWQRRTLRARYLATAAQRRIAATTIQLWQRCTLIAHHLDQQRTRRRIAATTIQLWQRRILLLGHLDGITQR
jgi:hypothetical protein